MNIEGLEGFVVYVGDISKQGAFYGLVLGLEEVDRNENLVSFEIGISNIFLIRSDDLSKAKGNVLPVLEVRDVRAFHKKLAAAGVEITREPHTNEMNVLSMSFNDPEKNEMTVIEMSSNTEIPLLAEAEISDFE